MESAEETPQINGINPRDISYAASAKTRFGQSVVRVVENLTGRLPALIKIYGYDADVAAGEPFWDCVWRRLKLSLDMKGEALEAIPASGPVVIVANHPYGFVDAAILGWMLSRRRHDFKILANALFKKAPELAPNILPVDFSEGRQAHQNNLQMRRDALDFLKEGGAIGIFPSGAIGSAQSPFGYPYDAEWKSFAAKMIALPGVTVVPLLFPGRNSMFFEVCSWISPNLRYGLNFFEFNRKIKKPVEVVLGRPIPAEELQKRIGGPSSLMQWLRSQTYALGAHLPYGSNYGPEGPPLGRRWP